MSAPYRIAACAHYHGVGIQDVGTSCPAAWVDPNHRVDCDGCEDFRFRHKVVSNDGHVVYVYTKVAIPTRQQLLFKAAMVDLTNPTPQFPE